MSYKIKAAVMARTNDAGKTEVVATCTPPYPGTPLPGFNCWVQLMLVARGGTKEEAIARLQQQLNEATTIGNVSSIEEIELDVPLPPTKAKD